jgi:hypothetical protein
MRDFLFLKDLADRFHAYKKNRKFHGSGPTFFLKKFRALLHDILEAMKLLREPLATGGQDSRRIQRLRQLRGKLSLLPREAARPAGNRVLCCRSEPSFQVGFLGSRRRETALEADAVVAEAINFMG